MGDRRRVTGAGSGIYGLGVEMQGLYFLPDLDRLTRLDRRYEFYRILSFMPVQSYFLNGQGIIPNENRKQIVKNH